jgi:hypothetical protein
MLIMKMSAVDTQGVADPDRPCRWFADGKRFTSEHRRLMDYGGSESAAP